MKKVSNHIELYTVHYSAPYQVPLMGFTYDFSLIGGVCVLSVITFGTPRLASIT